MNINKKAIQKEGKFLFTFNSLLVEQKTNYSNPVFSNASEIFERSEEEYIMERRDLAVQFILCLVLIEVLKQLPVHPGHEDLVNYIENLAFKNFKYRDG